jgi:hypothetical protein
VLLPSPQGVLRVGTTSFLVGKGIGPTSFTPVVFAISFISSQTPSNFWVSVLVSLMRARRATLFTEFFCSLNYV